MGYLEKLGNKSGKYWGPWARDLSAQWPMTALAGSECVYVCNESV